MNVGILLRRRRPLLIIGGVLGQALAFSYYTRWALTGTTLLFTLFTFSTQGGRLVRGMVASAAFLGYYELMYGGQKLVINGTVPAYAAAWLPNVALLA